MNLGEGSGDPRLLGALRKTMSPARGVGGVMDETHLSVFHSVSIRARGRRSWNVYLFAVRFQLVFFVRHSRYMIWLIFT